MKKIAVVGSINMDLSASAERIPKRGETVSGHDFCTIPGGKGANQAVAAARLGGNVMMFGCVGDDSFGSLLIQNLKEQEVRTEAIQTVSGVSSGLAMIVVAESDNCIVVVPGANAYVTVDYIRTYKEKLLESDIVLLQNEIPIETVSYVMELCHHAGKTVLYNPAPVKEVSGEELDKILEYTSYCTPNEHEAKLLFPEWTDLNELLKQQRGKLIVTLGAQGVAAWDEGKYLQIPARPAQVVDTTGAGDTFHGALAYALSIGYSIREALKVANIASSLSTEQFGAQGGMPDWAKVQQELVRLEQ